MKVKIKSLDELVRDCPYAEIRRDTLLKKGEVLNILNTNSQYEPWMYTEIKPEEVTAYAYTYGSSEIVWHRSSKWKEVDTYGTSLQRAEKYDIVFKGEDND